MNQIFIRGKISSPISEITTDNQTQLVFTLTNNTATVNIKISGSLATHAQNIPLTPSMTLFIQGQYSTENSEHLINATHIGIDESNE